MGGGYAGWGDFAEGAKQNSNARDVKQTDRKTERQEGWSRVQRREREVGRTGRGEGLETEGAGERAGGRAPH